MAMTRDLWAKQTAANLLAKYPKDLKDWRPSWHLEIWLRDNCHCVYCGCDLLQNRDITYSFYCYDHVLPKNKYPLLRDSIWNKVLACHSCNSWKGKTFDPAGEEIPPTEEYRDGLIERARRHVERKRATAAESFTKAAALIQDVLRDYSG